jgi:hypothetical protein
VGAPALLRPNFPVFSEVSKYLSSKFRFILTQESVLIRTAACYLLMAYSWRLMDTEMADLANDTIYNTMPSTIDLLRANNFNCFMQKGTQLSQTCPEDCTFLSLLYILQGCYFVIGEYFLYSNQTLHTKRWICVNSFFDTIAHTMKT